ncbi:hypothetical protein C9F11_37235 [Streptomyces sp. YIM 121038]|uniref:hypothetical protein n=1 Tax=Streptomyces sp. YIM 121038 TaxID=2136401 RepID=UPI001110EA2E|nr:hypothetical protein [Streptomyces sp. YIM 121038]QCX81030.1 hypothetical protein C9F11_37235 [Streptomyces sp. YIM 121038]
MSPNPSPRAAARPAAAVNEDIRNLWRDPRVRLTAPQRALYERLLAEWAAAARADIVAAA